MKKNIKNLILICVFLLFNFNLIAQNLPVKTATTIPASSVGYLSKFTALNNPIGYDWIGNSSIFDNGKVGIGTFSIAAPPKEKFQIGTEITIADLTTGKRLSRNVYFNTTASQYQRLVAGFASSIVFSNVGDMIFSTGTSGTANTQIPFIDVMAIKNSGKVGIGTNLPNVKLQIHSTEMVDGGSNGPMAPLVSYAYSALQITNTATTDAVDKGLYIYQRDLSSWITARSGSLSISANGVFQSTSNGFSIDAGSGAGNIDGASFRLNAQLGNIVFHNPVGGDVLIVNSNGNVGIGNTSPQNKLDVSGNASISGNMAIGTTVNSTYKLSVCGTIKSTEWIVETGWCDFVFEPNYKKPTWQEKENYLLENKHMLGVDPASEVEKNGLQVGKNIKGIVLNVEENSLDIIDLYKLIEQQNKKMEQLEKENIQLKNQIEQIKK